MNRPNEDEIEVNIDLLPEFLQDMAREDPEAFNEFMSNMDEVKLSEFISAQEVQRDQERHGPSAQVQNENL